MNTKSYFSKNKFFNNIIDEYYQSDPDCRWIKHDVPHNYSDVCDVDCFHVNKIIDCRILSQLEGVELLGNKKHQYKLMEQKKPQSIGDYIPKTYMFNKQNIQNLRQVFNNHKGKFIVKPDNSLSRIGITIITKYTQLYNYINRSPLYCDWILQEYVDNPLLYNGKKFHFRVFALLVKDARELKVYMYNKSFMYLANNKYKINIVDNESHLSGESSRDNVKVYPEDFTSYYGDQYIMVINEQLRDIIKNTIDPCAIYLKCHNDNIDEHIGFKLIGYDILIDKFNKCHLAEINIRQISLKYPPGDFKKTMYTNLLNLIHYPEKPTEFTHVTTIRNKNIVVRTLNDASHGERDSRETNNRDKINKDRDKRIEHFINKTEQCGEKDIKNTINMNKNTKISTQNNAKNENNAYETYDPDDPDNYPESDIEKPPDNMLTKLMNMDFKNLNKEEKYLLYGTIFLIILVIIGVVTSL